MEKSIQTLRLIIRDLFTSGMYDRCDAAVLYKFMMLNLVLLIGTPFVLGFGLFDLYRGIQPLGYIITAAGLTLIAFFIFLRKTKNYTFIGYFLVFILFWMFLYLLSTGGSGNSGILWYYSFPPIVLFLLGFRRGSAVVYASLAISGVILFWPGSPYLSATYSADIKLRFIPSVVILWSITSLFEHIMTAALKIEVKNNELRETIEELTKAEDALTKSHSNLQAIIDNIEAVVYVSDMDTYEVLLVNKYVRDMFGDIQGRTCWQTIQKGQTGPCSFCSNSKLIGADGKLLDAHTMTIQNTLNQRWYECRDKAIRWIDGRIVRVEIATDITERKNLEEQLRHAQKMEAVGILAGGVAHEFNNILSTIKGSAYIIEKRLAGDASLHKYSLQITDSIHKASTLAQGLLAFSRKQVIALTPYKVSDIVMRIEPLVSRLVGENIELNISLNDRGSTIMADSGQIEQVLINLAANARDAMQRGGRLTITTDLTEITEGFVKEHAFGTPGRYALITVSDTGTGMAEDIKDKIFQPFFTTKELGKGTGLGLSIVYGIIKQHNGHIEVKTRINEGTAFTIYIPAVESEIAIPADIHRPHVTGGLETILLAEDDDDARKIMAEVLKLEGYTVLDARDGEGAIRVFLENRGRIDLALLDVRMPHRDGKEVHDEISRLNPHIKTLFISGYTADVIDSGEFSGSGLHFISKSASPEEILLKIREVLDGPRPA
ncbi:MAG: PAS domain-containing hybrid sensor histidine kinase/response regulator [Nitrospirae bacterium]|nr:MAG: PAS domain-containing hybrid sensor histidine kinase/response regulator [Nitrospirota bacterium]